MRAHSAAVASRCGESAPIGRTTRSKARSGIVIDRHMIEADVIVVRGERDVLAAERGITARQNRDDVARREFDGRSA